MRIRLYTENKLSSGEILELDKQQSNYLGNVLRCHVGDKLFVFNGESGEFLAVYKDKHNIEVMEQTRQPVVETPLVLLFAPVKFGKIDYLVEKSTELGATSLQPVHTRFTNVGRINYERMKSNCVEAAEQTGRITIPEVNKMVALDRLLEKWDTSRKIIFCDETLKGKPIATALSELVKSDSGYAILIGPEGGFSKEETAILREKPFVVSVTMGKRILRAETAAIAALGVFQASGLGDWR